MKNCSQISVKNLNFLITFKYFQLPRLITFEQISRHSILLPLTQMINFHQNGGKFLNTWLQIYLANPIPNVYNINIAFWNIRERVGKAIKTIVSTYPRYFFDMGKIYKLEKWIFCF